MHLPRRPICVELDDGKSGEPRRLYFDDTLRLGYGEDCEIRLDGEGGPAIVCGLQRTRGPLRLWTPRRADDQRDDRLALQVDGHALDGGAADLGPGSRVEVLDRHSGRRYRLRVEPQSHWFLRPRVLLGIVAVLAVAGAVYGGYVYWSLRGAQEQIGRAEQRLRETELGVEHARSALAEVERRIAAAEVEVAAALVELGDAQAASGAAIREEFDSRLAVLTERASAELASLSERDVTARERLQAETRAAVETLRHELADRMVAAYQEFKRVETRLHQSLGEQLQAVEPPGVRFKRVLAEARGALLFVRTTYDLEFTRTGEVVTQESFGTAFFVTTGPDEASAGAAGPALTARHVLYPWLFERELQVLFRLGLVTLHESSVRWSVWTTGATVVADQDAGGERGFDLATAWRSDSEQRALRLVHLPPLATTEELVASPVGMVSVRMPVPGAGDVAVLQVMDFSTAPAPLELASVSSEPLDEALAVGYPLSRLEDGRAEPQAVIGFVRREAADMLELNTALNPGVSGGPVLDREGRVAGMAIGIVDSTVYGLAVPAQALAAVLAEAAVQVRTEEQRLGEHGCDPGPVDGVFDAATWNAYLCEKNRGD